MIKIWKLIELRLGWRKGIRSFMVVCTNGQLKRRKQRVLNRNSICRKKNNEFSFSIELMLKLVCLANSVVFYSVFSFKSLNTIITNCGFEFNSITAVLNNGI